MAKSTPSDRKSRAKRGADKTQTTDETVSVEDAVVEDVVTPDADDVKADAEDTVDSASETPASDEDTSISADGEDTVAADADLSPTSEDTLVVEGDVIDAPAEDDIDQSADEDTVDDTAKADEPPVVPVVAPAPVEQRKGSFIPMVLGGLIAGGVGFGAATYLDMDGGAQDTFQTDVTQTLTTQSETLDTLATRIDAVEGTQNAADLTGLKDTVADTAATLDDALSEVGYLSDLVAGFGSRLDAIEKQPLAAAVSPEAIAAYERELEELRTVLDDRKAEIEELVANERAAMESSVAEQRATIEALAAAADQAETSAEEKAALAAARNAMVDITRSVQQGAPYADALAALQDTGAIEVPEILTTYADDGVTSQDALVDAFPALAYKALAQARQEKTAEEGRSLSNFLETQLGGRSVVPREGDDPDAVLSRAEAAVKAGDLDTALTELSALPDTVQPVFADWVASATTRNDVLSAAAQLAQDLNQK